MSGIDRRFRLGNLSGLAVVFFVALSATSSLAADPASAAYSNDASRIFWIMHISDTHIGTEWYDEDSRFFWALQEALPVIQPELVINSGDLVDASISGIPASGQVEDEWSRYREIVDISGLPADFYIDIPGNHDLYGDSWFSYYLQWSLSGSTYNTTTRSLELGFPFGDYFIYTCATPGDEAKPFLDPAAFSQDELDEMQGELSAHDGDELIFVFGHHRPDQPDNADQARAMWRQHGAIYFHGHSHKYDSYLNDGVLAYEVNSLGKSTQENLAVIAVDNNYVAYAVTDSDDPWPFIVITAPADRVLQSGEDDPYAYQVCNSGEDNPVRALVFDRQPVTAVSFSVEGGESVAMTRDTQLPILWHGSFDTRGLAAGDVSLTVNAEGTKARQRSITVTLADVPCPEPWQPADGGIQDGDVQDGDGSLADQGPDAGKDAGEDAGLPVDSDQPDGGQTTDQGHPASEGCGCSTNHPASGLLLGLLLCLLLLLPRSRRKRHNGV
jgi:3',5'-cyclic-AMP phosphodiesterase